MALPTDEQMKTLLQDKSFIEAMGQLLPPEIITWYPAKLVSDRAATIVWGRKPRLKKPVATTITHLEQRWEIVD